MLILNTPQPSQLPSELVNLPDLLDVAHNTFAHNQRSVAYNYHFPHVLYFCHVELLIQIRGNQLV